MQEKQLKVLEVFKEMQKKDVFTMLASGNALDTLIQNARTYDNIASSIQDIKDYINDLEFDLSSKFYVSINDNLQDFNDKIQDEMFNIYLEPQQAQTKVYQKEVENGYAGNSTLGLKNKKRASNGDKDVSFTLEERKILKLINHYYLSLNPIKNKDVSYFFIPMKQLKIIFSDTLNHKLAKDLIITNCNRLQNKKVYWDYTKTAYAKNKKLTDKKLDTGKGSSLVNITLLFAPYDKNNNLELKGIICKVNKFMKLRLALKQMSNMFPTRAIKADYLEYVMMSNIAYLMNLPANKKRGYVKIPLLKQLNTIYTYKSIQSTTNYLSFIRKDKHKPRELQRFLQTLIDITLDFKSLSMYQCNFKIIANIFRGNSHIDTVEVSVMKNATEPRSFTAIYSELERIFSEQYKKVKDIQNLCNKLGNGNVSYDLVIDKSKKTNISNNIIDNLFKDIDNELDVEDIKNHLISNLSYTQGKLQEAVMLGRITFQIDFQKINS